jgi:hypothetical protein
MSDLLVIYSILVTSLLIVYFDYNKCYRKEKKKDVDVDTEDENNNDILNLTNSFCSDKPIVAYGMTFNIGHKTNRINKSKERSNTI